MADIELVIKISEDIYQEAIKSGYSHLYDEEVANAVADGTPLPKGHGRLIDESDLMPDSDYEDGTSYAVSIEQINSTPTIIEADTAESEDRCKNCEYSHNPDYTRCHECKAESEAET